MSLRHILQLLALGAAALAVAGQATPASAGPVPNPPASPHLNYGCGGEAAYSVGSSELINLVSRQFDEDDLYGGDNTYSACYGKHGRSRKLLKFTSPQYPSEGRFAFWHQFVALEVSSHDATCGKYTPDDCPTYRLVASWNAKTGRRIAKATPSAALTALAVSARGAIVWLQPAPAPAVGQELWFARSTAPASLVVTGDIGPADLAVTRTSIRYTDDLGQHTVALPAS